MAEYVAPNNRNRATNLESSNRSPYGLDQRSGSNAIAGTFEEFEVPKGSKEFEVLESRKGQVLLVRVRCR